MSAFNYPEAFARSLRFDRENKCLSTEQMAEKLSITHDQWLDIESGANMTPDPELVEKIASIFSLDCDILLIGFEEALRLKLEMQGKSN
jgi:transcriptional regulator with XRE-family HTH domain